MGWVQGQGGPRAGWVQGQGGPRNRVGPGAGKIEGQGGSRAYEARRACVDLTIVHLFCISTRAFG